MPLKPNFIERFLINRGMVPGLMTDLALPVFQFFAMVGAMEIGFFKSLKDSPAILKLWLPKPKALSGELKYSLEFWSLWDMYKKRTGLIL